MHAKCKCDAGARLHFGMFVTEYVSTINYRRKYELT